MGRVLGSVLGGVLLATTGTSTGFLLNAASFALVVATLSRLRNDELAPRTRVPPVPGQIREALTYVRSQPALAATAIVMIVVFVCAYNFQVALALIAAGIPGGGSQTYGGLMSALGLGFAAGSLLLARRASTAVPIILAWTCAIAAAQVVLSCVSTTIPLLLSTFAYGICAGLFTVTVMSTLQLTAADEMRGRVMALYSICFLGGSLIGAPGFGWAASWIGVSATLRAAASLCALTALVVGIVWQSRAGRGNGLSR
jgi:predicted MFS family arabinose efflux permease